ncbi:MAG: tetratricopeptide repeat protein [candidate division WOR-3 bacterium]
MKQRRHKCICLLITLFWINCAYFNTFYNAQKYYKEGQEKLLTNPGQAKASFEKAIEKSAKVISKYPRSRYVPNALFIIGMSYYYLGEYSKAIAKFDNLLLIFPETKLNYQVNYYYAQALIANRDYENALVRLKELIRDETQKIPGSLKAEVLYKLAELHYLREEYQEAQNVLTQLITEYPKSVVYFPALVSLGKVQQALGNYSDATATYKKGQTLIERRYPKVVLDTLSVYNELLVNLAKVYIIAGQESLGRAMLDKLVSEDSLKSTQKTLNDEVYLSLGKLFTQMNNLNEANKYFKKVKSPPAVIEAQWFLANNYETQGQFDSAYHYYQAVLTRRETTNFTTQAKIRLELLKSLKDTTVANIGLKIDSSRKIVNIVNIPENDANNNLEDTSFSDVTKTLLSQDSLKNVYEINPDSAKIQFQLAEIYHLNLKDYTKALVEYEKVYLKYPKSSYAPKALLAQAWIYKNIFGADSSNNNDHLKYETILKIIIKEYPNTEYAREAQKMLRME